MGMIPFHVGLALLWAAFFGLLLPVLSLVGDDLYHEFVLRSIPSDLPLSQQLWMVFGEAKGQGHFKPFQDALAILARAVGGESRWAAWSLGVHLVLHLFNAQLWHALLLRVGATPFVARASAILFLLHPAVDESLSQLLFAPNVLGLTGLLGAAVCLVDRHASSPSHLRLALAALFAYIGMSANVNMLVMAPLCLGAIALANGLRQRRFPFGAMVAVGVAAALTGLHRLLSYGTLTTKMATYRAALETESKRSEFAEQVVTQLLAFAPSASARELSGRLGADWPLGLTVAPPLLSGAALILLVVAAVMLARPTGAAAPRPAGMAIARRGPLLLAGLCFVSGLLPYVLFLDTLGLNRYLYPCLPGFAALLALAIEALGAGPWPLPFRRLAQGTLLAALLGVMLPLTADASASIARAHREVPEITKSIARQIEPGVAVFDAIAFPRAAPRATYWFVASEHLQAAVSLELGRPLGMPRSSWLADWFAGQAPDPRDPSFALFAFDDPISPRRIRHALDPREALTLRARLADELVIRADHARWAAGLKAETALEIGYWAEGLGRLDAGGQELVRQAFAPLAVAESSSLPVDPKAARMRSATALQGVVEHLVPARPELALPLLSASFDELDAIPGLVPKIIDAVRPGEIAAHRTAPWLDMLSRLSETADPGATRALLKLQEVPDLGDFGPEGRAELVRRATLVQRLRRGLRAGQDLQEAFTALRDLHVAWKERGIPRMDLWHEAQRAHLGLALQGVAERRSDLETGIPAHEMAFALTKDRPGLAAEAELGFLGSDLQSILRGGQSGDLHLSVRAGPAGLPGGASPWAAAVRVAWLQASAEPIAVALRHLPAPGLLPGHARAMSFALVRPSGSGAYRVRIELLLGGVAVHTLPEVPLVLP